jgi:hypothetical protein
VLRQLRGTAAGQHSYQRLSWIEPKFAAERGAIPRRVYRAYERVADEGGGHAGVAVKFLFERENAQRLGETAAHKIHAPWPPGPELRADVVNIFHAEGEQLARQAQMEARKIGENRELGFAALRFADQVLPPKYGFPMKLRIPTKLGFKNPKHIMAMFVTNTYPGGYWEDKGYNWFSGS